MTSDNRLRQQMRASAFEALKPTLQVVIFILLFLPAQALIQRIFRGKTESEWKLTLIVGGVLASVWFCTVFLSTLLDLRKHESIEIAETPSFPAVSFLSGLYGLTVVFSLVLMRGLQVENDPRWMQLLPLAFVGIAFYGWPRTIHCDETSVWQRDLWGRQKRIPYEAIESISVGADGTTIVLGTQSTIEHTQQHVGSERFSELLSRRSGKPVY